MKGRLTSISSRSQHTSAHRANENIRRARCLRSEHDNSATAPRSRRTCVSARTLIELKIFQATRLRLATLMSRESGCHVGEDRSYAPFISCSIAGSHFRMPSKTRSTGRRGTSVVKHHQAASVPMMMSQMGVLGANAKTFTRASGSFLWYPRTATRSWPARCAGSADALSYQSYHRPGKHLSPARYSDAWRTKSRSRIPRLHTILQSTSAGLGDMHGGLRERRPGFTRVPKMGTRASGRQDTCVHLDLGPGILQRTQRRRVRSPRFSLLGVPYRKRTSVRPRGFSCT